MAGANSSGLLSESGGPEGGTLRAQLAVEPHSDSDCTIVKQSNTSSLKQRLKIPHDCMETVGDQTTCSPARCGECHAELEGGDGTKQYLTSSVHSKCPCPVFAEYDCIPEIRGVRNGAIIAVVTIRDRTVLPELLGAIESIEATVSVDWLVRGKDTESTVELNVDEITTKQREALTTALEAGYYETPRETDLTALAAELSISESAVSQRLNTAETKLVKSFLE